MSGGPFSSELLVVSSIDDHGGGGHLRDFAEAMCTSGRVVRTATTVANAERILAAGRTATVVIDLQMQGEDAVDLVAEIGKPCAENHHVAVIAVSAVADPATIAAVFDLGAVDFVRSPFAREELVARVAASDRWQAVIRSAERNDDLGECPDPLAGLTPAERTVAVKVASGLTNRAIAAELFISVKAVEFHLGNIFRKHHVTNRTQLAGHLSATAFASESPSFSHL